MLKKSNAAKTAHTELLEHINELLCLLSEIARNDPEAFQITLEAKWLKAGLEEDNLHLPNWELTIESSAASANRVTQFSRSHAQLVKVSKLLQGLRKLA